MSTMRKEDMISIGSGKLYIASKRVTYTNPHPRGSYRLKKRLRKYQRQYHSIKPKWVEAGKFYDLKIEFDAVDCTKGKE